MAFFLDKIITLGKNINKNKRFKLKKNFKYIAGALICGFMNGIFGSGGGILVVPLLRSLGIESKKAHATSVLVILFLSILSFVLYIYSYSFNLQDVLIMLPFGMFGAFIGSFVLKNIKTSLLRRIFGVIVIFSSLRLFLR